MQETMTIMLTGGRTAPPEPVEIPRRVGNVRLGELIGEGAGGAVLSGFDEALNRRVAVKLLRRRGGGLDQAALAELASGLRSAARIKHANLVTVHAVESVDTLPVVVMEFVDGISLRELLARCGALDAPLALHIFREIAVAVEALHGANVVHRDLKPANVLFDRNGGVHVCDFGLACEVNAMSEVCAEHVAGSPLYMSPEMFDGQVSPQSDVYALGIVLFELLAGAPPFTASTITEMKAAHARGEAPMEILVRRNVAADVCELVRRAIHNQRFLRFKTATHVLRALDGIRGPAARADTLRSRLAGMVTAPPAAGERKTPPRADQTPTSMTTHDLVAERARRKREGEA